MLLLFLVIVALATARPDSGNDSSKRPAESSDVPPAREDSNVRTRYRPEPPEPPKPEDSVKPSHPDNPPPREDSNVNTRYRPEPPESSRPEDSVKPSHPDNPPPKEDSNVNTRYRPEPPESSRPEDSVKPSRPDNPPPPDVRPRNIRPYENMKRKSTTMHGKIKKTERFHKVASPAYKGLKYIGSRILKGTEKDASKVYDPKGGYRLEYYIAEIPDKGPSKPLKDYPVKMLPQETANLIHESFMKRTRPCSPILPPHMKPLPPYMKPCPPFFKPRPPCPKPRPPKPCPKPQPPPPCPKPQPPPLCPPKKPIVPVARFVYLPYYHRWTYWPYSYATPYTYRYPIVSPYRCYTPYSMFPVVGQTAKKK